MYIRFRTVSCNNITIIFYTLYGWLNLSSLSLISRKVHSTKHISNCKPRESRNYGLLQFALSYIITLNPINAFTFITTQLHLVITIVMHRHPRVCRAVHAYMVGNKIDRSAHTNIKRCINSTKQCAFYSFQAFLG